ncbi:mediator of RNA polymerase II transcription subunit 24-like isoform X3 [Mizuhopecten yessoensis]|uniref:mediator of RNA polymerase II transcription subunit 24-like isoform X3 n=1 Tax=Mizuhopecten yessoensis TaxID=6573 RepID=UPI000B458E54|nr:mediator of RNA polymerase II transcription subunit 24-like isoform X3 [Mizuhopecten yessoensis]
MDTKTGRQPSTFAGKVKALLMRAWRERWTDIQWGVQLKKVLASTGGDPKDLPEILVHQALVGPNPNTLILSFLKYTVLSQVVPPSAAFNLITSFDDLSKPFCTLGLIDLAEAFACNLSFTCSLDSSLTLCKCLQNTLHWLMLCIHQSLQMIKDGHTPLEILAIIDSASVAAQKIGDNTTVQALLYVAMSEDTDKFHDFEQTKVNVQGTLSQLQSDVVPSQTRLKVASALKSLLKVQDLALPTQSVLEVSHLAICPTINGLVSLEAILNPTSDVQPFVEQLCVTEKLLKLNRSYLYCELFRACFMGLVDSADSQEELKWAAFTYLKLPQVLLKFNQQAPGQDFGKELEQGFDLLLNSVPLLDLTDVRLNCEALLQLIHECMKYDLLSQPQIERLLTRRRNESAKPAKNSQPTTQPSASLILRAESTVTSILKTLEDKIRLDCSSKDRNTLDADCSKNQDALMGVLCQMLSGKSFELILAAAAATGELQSFATKLIKINEFAKQTQGEAGKAAQTRVLLFDISFLMLCHITQLHGIEIFSQMISMSPEYADSFFIQWAQRCLPEDGRYKCVDNYSGTDQAKVDLLLSQLTRGDEIKQSSTKWHEICLNAPFAIQEVLFAWEHGALGSDNVKVILERSQSRMCSIPVVMSAWLCSYMNTVGDDAREKPLQMLQRLQVKISSPDPEIYYGERSHLMGIILRKMVNDILPPHIKDTSMQFIPPNAVPSAVMEKCLKGVMAKGWIDLRSVHTLEQLLNLCGSDWFCDRAILHMLNSSRLEDLTQALGLLFAVFHLDLEHITLSLLLHTVPKLLQSADKQQLLTDPRGYILAKACVLCIVAAQTARSVAGKATMSHTRRGYSKRSRKEMELESLDEPDSRPVKRMKTMEPQLTLDSEGFNLDFLTAKDDGEASPIIDTKDPLNKALANLLRLMNAIAHSTTISPRTSFIVAFIEESIKCGGQYSQFIHQFIPPQMLSQIMKSIPGVFSNQQIVHICNLAVPTGRKVAAKCVCQNSKIRPE